MAFKQLKLWFDKDLAKMLSAKLTESGHSINKAKFVKEVDKGVQALELKDRVELIADLLLKHLGEDYKKGLACLVDILGPENEEETGMFKEYYWVMPIAKYVEKYGLNNYAVSIKALGEITKRNTSEYAIRPFIEKYPERTVAQMLKWSKSKNFHLRRLASEGGRPRLPWASKIDAFINDPSPLIPILENLKDDSVKYVQKSVANCMNDILKDNFEIGQSLINDWEKAPTKECQWIIGHSLRNFKKKEDPWALGVLAKIGKK